MKLAGLHLRQRDGISCGPTVAVVAAALLRPEYGRLLHGPGGTSWFDAEQLRLHRAVNRVWPRRLGMTPCALAGAITRHSAVAYRWRPYRSKRLDDVVAAVRGGFPVAMLVGNVIPRHWVLFVDIDPGGDQLHCYEPTSGTVRVVGRSAVRRARLTGLGYPRPFAFVLPDAGRPRTRCVP
jgi:hypothetical protein